jgi:hypothetical protein
MKVGSGLRSGKLTPDLDPDPTRSDSPGSHRIRSNTAVDPESLFRIWIRIRLGQTVPDLTGSGLKLRLIQKANSGSD